MLTDSQKETLGYLSTMQAVISKVEPLTKMIDVDFWSFGKSDASNFSSSTPNFSNGGSPFGFLVNLFSIIGSYDAIINFISKYVVYALPALEIAVKGVLLSNLKGMAACNADPRIPNSLRKEQDSFESDNSSDRTSGAYIGINSIDYAGILRVSPLTEEGASYYFGTYTESAPKQVDKAWRDYTAKEKLDFIKSKGATTPKTPKTVRDKTFVGPYELARAADFNAFIWFAIHKAYFPSPIVLNIKPNKTISEAFADIGAKSVNEIYLNQNEYSFRKMKSTLSQFFMVSDLNKVPGSTMVEKVQVSEGRTITSRVLSMCYKTTETENNGQTTCTSFWAPVSNDWNSANWYTDPANYFSYNLSLPKAKRKKTDYNRMKPVLNLQYVNSAEGGNTNDTFNLLVSVPPKAFRAICPIAIEIPDSIDKWGPAFSEFREKHRNITALPSYAVKITFNEEGMPDKNGHFSLPNGFRNIKLDATTDEPYVRLHRAITEAQSDECIRSVINYVLDTSTSQSCIDTIIQIAQNHAGVNAVEETFNWILMGCYSETWAAIQVAKTGTYGDAFGVSNGIVNSEEETGKITIHLIGESMLNYFTSSASFTDMFSEMNLTVGDMNKVIDYLEIIKTGCESAIFDRAHERIGGDQTIDQDYIVYDVGDGFDNCKLYVKKLKIDFQNIKNLNNYKTEYFLTSADTISDEAKKQSSAYTYHMQECYPGSTVYELNYDMVMGMKFFDAKVVSTALVNALFNINIGLGISIPSREQNEVAEEIREIVREILNKEEETTLSDCFFTFSNEKFSSMLERTELQYLRKKDLHSPSRYVETINTEKLNEILAEYDENGTLNQQEEVITRFFHEAGEELSDGLDENMTETDKQQVQVRFATNLLGALAGVLVDAILTPKLMLVYQFNRKIMGGDIGIVHTFKDFFMLIKNLLYSMIKEIVELIIKEMLNFLVSLIKKMVEMVASLMIKETIDEYKELFRKLIEDCLPNIMLQFNIWKGSRTLLDTTIPVVEYADIAESIGEPVQPNC